MEVLWFLIKFVFYFILGFSFLHAIVTHFVFLYEMRLKSLEDGYPHKISFLILLKSFVTEVFCNFSRLILTPFLGISYKVILSNTETKTPILLIHGYGQNQMDWFWFRHKLKEKNVGPIYAINLCPPFASIVELAEQVKKKIEAIHQETEHPNIILIGHSMGGLVSSYYSEFLATPGEVSAVITLGSPFQGTKLAALGYGKNVIEMAPNSQFLTKLAERIKSSSIQYHHVASKIDNLIVPWESALPIYSNGSSEKKLILEDHGHLSLLISKSVINQVIKWIIHS